MDPALTQNVEEGEAIAPQGEKVSIRSGHVDIGPVFHEGQWRLRARDDTAATPTWRSLEDITFHLGEESVMNVPSHEDYSFVGAEKAWVIPQTEVKGVPWLGWNTQAPAVVTRVNGGVEFTFGGHQGPGHFALFVQEGNFGAPRVLVDPSASMSQSIFVETRTHTHANWVFTEPGIHYVQVSVTATLSDGTTVTDTATLRFGVGSENEVAAALENEAHNPATPTFNDPGEAAIDIPSQGEKSRTYLYIAAVSAVSILALLLVLGLRLLSRRKLHREVFGSANSRVREPHNSVAMGESHTGECLGMNEKNTESEHEH